MSEEAQPAATPAPALPVEATSVSVRPPGDLKPHQLVGKHAISGRKSRAGPHMAANSRWAARKGLEGGETECRKDCA